MKIFLDIETTGSPTPPSPKSIKAPANYKDPEKIRSYQLEAVDKEWRKEALNPLKGQVVCICFAIDDRPVDFFARLPLTPEEEILKSVQEELIFYVGDDLITWCGHNIAEFDLQWIKLRAMKYGLTWLLNRIDLNRYHGNFEDTLQATGSWNDKYSQHDLCAFFGIKDTQDVDGSMVFDLWRAGEINKIVEHCRQDVEQARALNRIVFRD